MKRWYDVIVNHKKDSRFENQEDAVAAAILRKVPGTKVVVVEYEKEKGCPEVCSGVIFVPKTYTAIWIGGPEDGEPIRQFDNEREAVRFARKFWEDHGCEFDPVCGGVDIMDSDGEWVDW